MNKKYLKRRDYLLYLRNKKNLQEIGTNIDNNIICYTYDYNFIPLLNNTKIKDFKAKDLKKYKEVDPEYYDFQLKRIIFNNIKFVDFLFGDWWRIYNTKLDKLYYLTIFTPYLRQTQSKDSLDLEIIGLINKHYHQIFGYGKDYYIEPKFIRSKNRRFLELTSSAIKDTRELIFEWIQKNTDSEEYNYYKSIILKNNNQNLSLDKIIINKSEKEFNSLSITIPYNCNLTYPDLFNLIFEEEHYSNLDYSEYNILKLLDLKMKDFLIQFKPIIYKKIKDTKKRKRKGLK